MQDHNYFLFTKQYDHTIISRCNCKEKVEKFDVEKEYKKFFKVKKSIVKKRKKKRINYYLKQDFYHVKK